MCRSLNNFSLFHSTTHMESCQPINHSHAITFPVVSVTIICIKLTHSHSCLTEKNVLRARKSLDIETFDLI